MSEQGSPPRNLRIAGDYERLSVGPELAKLRKQRGLTGQALAKLAGMSQSKISKIEVGSVVPSTDDVDRLARALGASEDQVTALIERAEGHQDELVDVRFTARRMISTQEDLASLEQKSRSVHVFQPAVVPGLLQTAEYARAVLSDYAEVFVEALGGSGADQKAVPPAVTARVARQEVLYDTDKSIHLVLMETVLMNRVCGPADMLAQVERIRTVSSYPNVTIGIVPATTELSYPPLHGFHLLDDRNLMIDLANTSVSSRGRDVLRIYRTVFDYFASVATVDIGPILDRYAEVYADLARPS
jgi:transcriptional regulator with XRE-family HTH domain